MSFGVSVNTIDHISVMTITGNQKSNGMTVLLCGINIAPL
jgi:hypothetical protein